MEALSMKPEISFIPEELIPNRLRYLANQTIVQTRDSKMGRTKKKNSTKKYDKKFYERWYIWVGILGGVFILLNQIFDFQKNIKEELIPMLSTSKDSCFFSGRVIDVNNNPIVSAEIIVQGKKGSGFTDDNGEFNFDVKSKSGTRVQIFVKINGEIKYNGSQTLPGPVTIRIEETQ